ncbi:MAG: translation elongation factor Ts [Planctomycetaceae bacterium]|jgi:elongation factor Ts|nr:translation elongation factor Ts [Planctomycetaceae bacterium]
MAEITAALVKSFRERTGLPMMECKKALIEANGDEDLAIELLRKAGKKTMEKRSGRETEAGRIAVYFDEPTGVTAMVELLCESAPVASTDEFGTLIANIAEQLAKCPGAKTSEDLLAQPVPGNPSKKLQDEYDDLVNKIREVFKLNRMIRVENKSGSYVHHNGGIGVVVEIEGDNTALARDICMHVASMRPKYVSKEEVDPAAVAKEKAIVGESVRVENANKPENIIDKIIEGRMKTFYADQCLLEQPFVKEQSKTVAQIANENNIKILNVTHWVLGQR